MLKFLLHSLESLGKYFIMLAEYTFAGVVIGSIITKDVPFERTTLIASGLVGSFVLLTAGLVIQYRASRKLN